MKHIAKNIAIGLLLGGGMGAFLTVRALSETADYLLWVIPLGGLWIGILIWFIWFVNKCKTMSDYLFASFGLIFPIIVYYASNIVSVIFLSRY